MACDNSRQVRASGATYLSRSSELLWTSSERPARGPRPGLTLAQIVDAAVRVADADGLDGLSMRRVAGELEVGTMSLYRYVPGKAELLDLMLDRVSDPAQTVAQAKDLDWRGATEVLARTARQLYLQHPWLLQANWSRPVFGPNTLAGFEFAMVVLDGLHLDDQERIAVVTSVDGYVTGVVRQEILYARAAEESGISHEQFWAHQYPVLERAMATGDYPAIAALSTDAFDMSWEGSFEFGLQRLLDGIEALVKSRR